MRDFKDRVAVVTGAASGIGRATALALAQEGAHLALWDVDEAGLEQTRKEAEPWGVSVRADRVDVADREAVFRLADEIAAGFGRVNLVVNNAGVALGASLEAGRYEDFEWLMGVNFWGVVHGTKAFLPHLKRAEEGHVVNVSSVFGIIAFPENGAYNAAKFAVRGFTECLRQELELDGCNVSATCVHPGGIRTNIARNSRMDGVARSRDDIVAEFDRLARTSPEQAARKILAGVRRNRRRVLIGPDAHVIDWVQRLLPTTYQRIVRRAVARERSRRA